MVNIFLSVCVCVCERERERQMQFGLMERISWRFWRKRLMSYTSTASKVVLYQQEQRVWAASTLIKVHVLFSSIFNFSNHRIWAWMAVIQGLPAILQKKQQSGEKRNLASFHYCVYSMSLLFFLLFCHDFSKISQDINGSYM